MNAQRNTPVVSILASSRSQEQAPEPDPRDYSLLQAVDASIKAADWLTGADRAAMTLARTYAAAIDSALAEHLAAKRADIGGDWALVSKLVSGAGPNLQKTLHSLGLTPEARGDLDRETADEDEDPLADFAKAAQEAMGKQRA